MGTIGIIGAMEVEVKELKEQMQITRQLTKAGMEFCEGILEGQDVVVVRSGVEMCIRDRRGASLLCSCAGLVLQRKYGCIMLLIARQGERAYANEIF